MNRQPFPGYENHYYGYTRADSEALRAMRGAQREDMSHTRYLDQVKARDLTIEGPAGDPLVLTLVCPKAAEGPLPMILYIHGGGFMRGKGGPEFAEFAWRANVSRCAALAIHSGAMVASVDYRLCDDGDGCSFPDPMLDCHTAYHWLIDHAAEIRGDGTHVGLCGVSAGGCIAEGLALYLRDRNEQAPALTALDCPLVTTAIAETPSYAQMYDLRMGGDNKALSAEALYAGGYNGTTPSYYAFPAFCHDVAGLGPHLILTAEYDTLRDSAIAYARRLLNAAVPTELITAPRVAHCFSSLVDHPYSELIGRMIGMSFRRELGLLEELRK